jgi:hypothetical protein
MSRAMLKEIIQKGDPREEESLKSLSKVWYSYIRLFNIWLVNLL